MQDCCLMIHAALGLIKACQEQSTTPMNLLQHDGVLLPTRSCSDDGNMTNMETSRRNVASQMKAS
jgi:hypothetical protein